MLTSRLLQSLRLLDPEELGAFQAFVQNDYFNSHKRLRRLLALLLPYAPDFQAPQLDKQNLFSKLLPGQPYQAHRIRDDASLLYRLLKDWASLQAFRQDSFQQELYALDFFQKKGAEHIFSIEHKALEKKLKEGNLHAGESYRRRFLIADQANELYGQKLIRTADFNLQDKLDHLDHYYVALRLRETCEALNRQYILNVDYRLHLLEEWEGLLERPENAYLRTPLINSYYAIFRCLRQPEKLAHYEQLVSLLQQHKASIEPRELRALYKYAQNYCIRKINEGQQVFQHRLFLLYQEQLTEKLILKEGKLAHTDYKNIATLALRLQEYDWLEDFLPSYRPFIHTSHRENAYSYCFAAYLAEIGKRREAIRKLQAVEFTDTFYDLSARHLLARIYFEEEEWESLAYHLNAFNLFLRRNTTLSPDNKKSHQNFVRLLIALTKLKEREAYSVPSEWEVRRQKLSIKLASTHPLAYQEWLKTQVNKRNALG